MDSREHSNLNSLKVRLHNEFTRGEQQLVIFRRQYLQRIPLAQFRWPAPELLRDYEVQQWIYITLKKPRITYAPENISLDSVDKDEEHASYNASRWEKSLWAELLKRIESAVEGTEEPDIFDPLMEECAKLQLSHLLSEVKEAQQDIWITYELGKVVSLEDSKVISLLERPRILSGSRCTGHRTWEAALALGREIFASWLPSQKIRGSKILELGAGTGLLSLLCASRSSYGPRRVIATDGDQEAIERLQRSIKFNAGNIPNLLDRVECGVYKWGDSFEGTVIGDEIARDSFDTVLAADVTYDPESVASLAWTLAELHKHNRNLTCVLSANVRNQETFDKFLQECKSHHLHTALSAPESANHSEQEYLFHSNEGSIQFVRVTPL